MKICSNLFFFCTGHSIGCTQGTIAVTKESHWPSIFLPRDSTPDWIEFLTWVNAPRNRHPLKEEVKVRGEEMALTSFGPIRLLQTQPWNDTPKMIALWFEYCSAHVSNLLNTRSIFNKRIYDYHFLSPRIREQLTALGSHKAYISVIRTFHPY